VLLLIDGGGCGSAMGRWREEEEEDDMWGARESVIGERAFNAIYVFIYTCSWAQVVSIRIPCHFCEKRKIVRV
jgi:hypothetical protein